MVRKLIIGSSINLCGLLHSADKQTLMENIAKIKMNLQNHERQKLKSLKIAMLVLLRLLTKSTG